MMSMYRKGAEKAFRGYQGSTKRERALERQIEGHDSNVIMRRKRDLVAYVMMYLSHRPQQNHVISTAFTL